MEEPLAGKEKEQGLRVPSAPGGQEEPEVKSSLALLMLQGALEKSTDDIERARLRYQGLSRWPAIHFHLALPCVDLYVVV